VAIVCFAGMAGPFFLGRVYVADDLGQFHLPLRDFYSRQLRAGGPFDWMPSLYGGFYVTGEGQLGAYHPWHRLLYRWLPLDQAFDLELLASYPLMFVGTFLFLLRWLARRDAALYGAVAFTFCGFNLLHFVHPNAVAIVAHLPWLLLAMEVALTSPAGRNRAAAELAVGLLTASQLLLGYPQYAWLSLLLEAAYVAWRSIAVRAPVLRPAMLAVAVLLGGVTAGVQLVPTFDALGQSTRATSDAAFAGSGALHPLNVVQLVAPYLFATRVVGQNTHELGLYAGAAPLLVCIWLVAQRRRWGKLAPLVWATIAMGGLALLLALGDAGRLCRIQSLLPVVSHFRFPCRAIVLVQFCTAVAAAVGFAIVQSGPIEDPNARRRGERWLAAAVAVSIGLAIVGPVVWPEFVASPWLVWLGPILIAVAAGLVALAARGVRFALVGLVVFTGVDLCVYGFSYAIWRHTSTVENFVAEVPLPPGGAGQRVAAFAVSGGPRVGDRMLLAGLARVDGYAGLEPRKQLDYTSEKFLRLAGVRWVWHPTVPGSDIRGRWTAVSDPAPRARFADAATPQVSARIAVDKPGHMLIECGRPESQQLLVTTESYHPGWRASVEGAAGAVVRVDGDFLGCVVPAGTDRVDLWFQPDSLRWGAWCSACGLGLLLCMFAVRARPRDSSPA
jgi:hypothetical protein